MIEAAVREDLAARRGAFEVSRSRDGAPRSNFYYAFAFLPKRKRRGIKDIYAFCRLTDDLADEAPDGDTARAQLDAWRDELRRAVDGEAGAHPLAATMARCCADFGIDTRLPHLLIEGCRMDVEPPAFETDEQLNHYCFHVASVVGLMIVEVFGYRDRSARDYGVLLGQALQHTNILRDLGTDAKLGRVYLPRETMRRFGLTREAVLNCGDPCAIEEMVRAECARARAWYDDAERVIAPQDRFTLAPMRVMAAVYETILDRVEQAGSDVCAREITVPTHQKVVTALGVFARSLVGR